MGGIEREILVFGPLEQVEFDEAGNLGQARVPARPNLFELPPDPFFTRKRFMGMTILLSFQMHRPTRGPARVCTGGMAL
jgi:hypothetical protein